MTTKTKLMREGREFLKTVLAANHDLATRVQALSVAIAYDRDDDTFTLTLGEPQAAMTESLAGGHVYIRLDPDTLKLVGIEIPGLSERIQDHPTVKQLWLAARNVAGPCRATDVPETVAAASELLHRELWRLAAA